MDSVAPSASPHVAVLDDDGALALGICRVLCALGLHAEPFSSPADFTAASEQRRYDAFVLDWMLGTTTAETVIPRLRNRHPRSPIFLYTGNLAVDAAPVESEIASLLRDCQVTFRQKPYSNRQLAADIREAVLAVTRSSP